MTERPSQKPPRKSCKPKRIGASKWALPEGGGVYGRNEGPRGEVGREATGCKEKVKSFEEATQVLVKKVYRSETSGGRSGRGTGICSIRKALTDKKEKVLIIPFLGAQHRRRATRSDMREPHLKSIVKKKKGENKDARD